MRNPVFLQCEVWETAQSLYLGEGYTFPADGGGGLDTLHIYINQTWCNDQETINLGKDSSSIGLDKNGTLQRQQQS